MADIRLAKPAAGTTQTVPSAPDGRFIFDFPADAATLTRNGDDLVLTFDDGAAIQLQGFYTTYSKEEMPSFQVDGVEISGQDFFAALDEDLMPAAGPASGSSAARGGRYNEYGGSDLLDGLDHLGRLDIGFDGGTQLATDTVEPSPYSEVDHGVTVTPSTPGTDPDDPSIPVQGEDFPPTMPHDVLQVDESALDGGSGGGSATAAGSMRVSAPDGVAIITIGVVVVWQNGALTGNPVLTDEGHLDVTGFDGTNLTYTYTLTGSTQEHAKLNAGGENDAIAHEMAVVVTDRDGDSGSAVIRVEITDDVPTIKSFERDVTEGDADPIVGNALEGAVAGADGANFAWTNPDQQGRYGKLTLNEDGTYSYELNNDDPEVKALTDGDTRTEEISYTYTDADGDVAEGKVTITINGVNNGVEVGSGTLTVYEAGLDDGSTPGGGNTPTTASGSLHINAPDGVATIAIGEVTVFKNGALTGNTVSTDEGTLTVTGFDAATGELTFTYELTGNTLEHNTEATDKQMSHNFAVTVTDVDDSTASSTITVNIVDDEPTAKNDSVLFEEAAAQKGVSGESVLENDVFGADAPASKTVTSVNDHKPGETVSGTYGELTLHADGTYTYKLGDEVDVPNGKIYTENFTYTITDADGDTSTATLTIAIEGDKIVPANPGNATIVVDEALLPGGNVVNSDNFDHVSLGNGSFTVNLNGEDGTITLKYGTGENSSITLSLINGDPFDETWLSTNTTLTVNGVEVTVTGATQQDNGSWKIEYKYSLTGQQTHTGKGVGEDDALSDDIDITVTDATGDTSTGSLTVTVHDDGPVLNAKIDFQPKNEEGFHYDTDNTIVFNLADSSGEKALQDIDFGADVGTGEEGSAPASITVTVNDTEFTVTVTRDAEGKLLFNGENTGTITFEKTGADDGSALTYDTATGKFTYTRPTADVGGAADNYTFTLTVTDADGDTVQQTGSVVTVFKEPTITGDDGSTSSTVTTDEGNLEQGSGWETDATRPHKDTASGELTVNLDHADGTIQIGENLTIGVDKDGKVVSVNGTDGAALDGERVPGGHGYLSNITVSEADENGNITIHYIYTLTDAVDGDAPGAATGNNPADGEDGRGESMQADSFTVTVTANGQTATGSIMANALDDAPRLSVTPEATSTQNDTDDSSLSGTFTVNFGADGPSENAALKIADHAVNIEGKTTLEVDGGTLTITHKGGGTYAYTYNHVQPDVTFEKKTFTVIATDGDKDTTQATITVGQDFHPTTTDGLSGERIHETVTTDESYMEADGSQAGQNPDDGIGQSAMESVTVNLHGENTDTSITVKHGQDSIRFTYDGMKWSAEGQGSKAVIQGDYGQLSVWVDTTGNNVTISYEYKQTAPYIDHDNPNNANEIATDADKFDIEINDGEDTPLTGSISVNIQDDAPTISVTGLDTAVDSGTSAHGNWTHSFGADVPTTQTITVNDQPLMLTDGGSVEVAGENGTLTVYANGTYTYTAKPNASGNDTFRFHIMDADGDSKDATLEVAVNNSTVKPENMTFTTQDANVALNRSDSKTLPLEEGVTLTQKAVDVVNTQIDYGQFSLSDDGKSLIFTQNSPYTHGEGENSHTFEQVSFAVTDANGNETTLNVTVTITDDAPSISVDQEASGAYGEKITGSVAIDFGADTGDQTRVTVSLNKEEAVEGKKDANGNYTFTFDDGSTLTLDGTTGQFSYDGVPASGTGTSYT
ncbi:Ig-like domain-containing protein, partial [Desulfovibrio piger]|uniref:Ig-like domain-containing protein n=1 Tax=Desulfovibrio piger TaxID=901 RepID=UPI00307FCA1E